MPIAPTDGAELNDEYPSLQEPPRWSGERWARGRRLIDIVLSFLLGHGAVQVFGILGGLLLVRTLSTERYAQYALTTAFQAVIATLMDLGLTSTIIPLVGERRNDRALVGRYVRAAQHLRNLSFLILAPLATLVFVAIMHKHHWSWPVQCLLVASVLVSLYSSGKLSYFSAPLLLYGKIREFYLPQVITAAVKLLTYVALALSGSLSAWVAAGLSALTIAANAELVERKSRPLLRWPDRPSKPAQKEIIRYVLPAVPAAVFAAFQPQISLLLVGAFGGTVDLAQVAALGRIAQIFLILSMFNIIVVEPYVARLSRAQLGRTFLGLLLLATAGCVPLVLLGFWHPQTYLWLLGPKYANLTGDMGLLILGTCISYIAGLLWIMNRARKWLFWSGTVVEIVLVLSVQATYLALVGVRTVRQAVVFTFVGSFGPLIAHAYVSIYGFILERRNPA